MRLAGIEGAHQTQTSRRSRGESFVLSFRWHSGGGLGSGGLGSQGIGVRIAICHLEVGFGIALFGGLSWGRVSGVESEGIFLAAISRTSVGRCRGSKNQVGKIRQV